MFTCFFRRLRARLKYRHFDRDLRQEIEVHRAMAERDLEARGVPPIDVRSAAARIMGNTTYMREEARRVRLGSVGLALDQVRADLVDGARSLRRSPWFTITAVGVLALGIGLNATIFSVVKAVFLPTSSVPSPETLVYITGEKALPLRDFRAATETALVDFASHGRPSSHVVIADSRAARLFGEDVSERYFDVIGIKPAMGRTFRAEEGDPASPAKAIVIAHSMWIDLFESDPAVIGKAARIEGDTFIVIGVMPATFAGLSAPWRPTDFWRSTIQTIPASEPAVLNTITEYGRRLVGRLRRGVTVQQATMAAAPIARVRILVSTKAPIAFADDGESAAIAMIASTVMAVGLAILLIAGTNIAGVLSARAVSREREFAVRQALGAGGWRIIQQRLLESLLLAAGGGIAGVGVASVCIRLYRAYSPAELVFDAPLDLVVLAYVAVVCLGAGVAIGLTPALKARRPELLTSLGGGVSAGIPRRIRRRLQYGVLVPQIFFSVVLLMVGGVYGTTLLRMEVPDPGYRVDDVVTATYTYADSPPPGRLSSEDYGQKRRVFDSLLLDRLSQTAGVAGAALSSRLPSDHMAVIYTRWIGTDAGSAVPGMGAEGTRVSPGYFSTLGIPLLRGRDFANTDVVGAPAVAIVSESFARSLWQDADPIGRSFIRLNQDGTRGGAEYAGEKQVIGVVADTRSPLQTGDRRLSFYIPLRQSDVSPGVNVFILASGPAAAVTAAIHTAVNADPLAHVLTVQSIEATIASEMYPFRAAAWLFGVAGVAGIFFAAMGLYGVVAHTVAQQTREFGIRLTLGATKRDITSLVLMGGGRIALLATVPGLLVAFLTLRAASRWVEMAPVIDLLTIASILAFIIVVVLGACYVPARRAGRVNPADTLRAE